MISKRNELQIRRHLRSDPAREFYRSRTDLVDDLVPTVVAFLDVLNALAATGDFDSAAQRYFESVTAAVSGSPSGIGWTPIVKAHFAWTTTGQEPDISHDDHDERSPP